MSYHKPYLCRKNKVMDKIDFILKLADSHTTPNRADLAICKAIIDTLSEEEAHNIGSCNFEIDSYISWRFSHIPSKAPVHYKSWQTYFNDLKLRRRGVYYKSRRILCHLLPYIGWTGQLKVIYFLINSPIRTEQNLACTFLLSHWEIINDLSDKKKKEWYNIIIEAWLQNMSIASTKLIVRHFPIQYIQKYSEKLIEQFDYFHVAVRLASLPTYNVKRELLTDNEYFYIMAKTNRDVSEELCQQALAKLLLSKAKLTTEEKLYLWEERGKYSFSFLLFKDVSKIVWCFSKMKKSTLLMQFYRFDKMVQRYLSHRFERTDQWEFREYIEAELQHLLRFYSPIIQFKKGLLEKMITENPHIGKLVRELQLYIE